jgi:hypothetical protein
MVIIPSHRFTEHPTRSSMKTFERLDRLVPFRWSFTPCKPVNYPVRFMNRALALLTPQTSIRTTSGSTQGIRVPLAAEDEHNR